MELGEAQQRAGGGLSTRGVCSKGRATTDNTNEASLGKPSQCLFMKEHCNALMSLRPNKMIINVWRGKEHHRLIYAFQDH
jgi:hypothetical protein